MSLMPKIFFKRYVYGMRFPYKERKRFISELQQIIDARHAGNNKENENHVTVVTLYLSGTGLEIHVWIRPKEALVAHNISEPGLVKEAYEIVMEVFIVGEESLENSILGYQISGVSHGTIPVHKVVKILGGLLEGDDSLSKASEEGSAGEIAVQESAHLAIPSPISSKGQAHNGSEPCSVKVVGRGFVKECLERSLKLGCNSAYGMKVDKELAFEKLENRAKALETIVLESGDSLLCVSKDHECGYKILHGSRAGSKSQCVPSVDDLLRKIRSAIESGLIIVSIDIRENAGSEEDRRP